MTMANEVGVTTFTTPSDREVVVARTVDAPRRLVWEVWTSPEHLPHWMLGPAGWTMPVCQIDLRPGGAYRFVWRRPDGSEMGISGRYQEVTPPERLVSTESWDGWSETVNTLTLTEAGGRTLIRQSVRYESRQARDAALQTGMKDGMTKTFEQLDAYLAKVA
jgi:uncharacterized protein YndB with AHSA1/START domain